MREIVDEGYRILLDKPFERPTRHYDPVFAQDSTKALRADRQDLP